MTTDQPFPVAHSRPWWTVPLSWSVLLSVALVVYELTDQTGLAAAIGCSKFGWKDYLTARWLYRRDPNRARGRVCWWFYMASALWKITLAAFGVIGIITLVESFLLNPQLRQDGKWTPPPTFIGGSITTAVGLTLAILAGHVALVSAVRSGCRVWLDWAIHRAREEDAWPPPYRLRNYARLLLEATVVITECAVMVLAIYWMSRLLPPGPLLALSLLGFLVVLIIAGPRLTEPHVQRAVARDPGECWKNEADERLGAAEGPSPGEDSR